MSAAAPKQEARPWPALVLGGRGDIGAAISARLARDGAQVHAVGRQDFDLTVPEAIDAFFEGPRPDYRVVVHAAGLNHPRLFSELSLDQIRENLDANLMGFLQVMKHLAPALSDGRGGRVVIISSLYGFLARRGRLPYVASKHALIGVMKTLAIELGPTGVLVNAVSPGYVDTKMTRANNDAATVARLAGSIPLARLATVDEIAGATAFLCGRDNTYVTGHDLVIDGGYSTGAFQG